ncbi:hypothetical protein AC579_7794 [Pseudocercospora musae]|uniref:Uncharacterized protein n=1 Tax=Pseudocercospora musae TaxID=113226 RepID=A0A139IJ43_9PEZI|nr:hypothetical protein AC579_7794 [Pseudocercospora musae]
MAPLLYQFRPASPRNSRSFNLHQHLFLCFYSNTCRNTLSIMPQYCFKHAVPSWQENFSFQFVLSLSATVVQTVNAKFSSLPTSIFRLLRPSATTSFVGYHGSHVLQTERQSPSHHPSLSNPSIMHPSILAIFLSATTASAVLNLRASTFSQLVGRQAIPITTCFGSAPSTEPNPCEYICGEGSRQCVSEGNCFNPTKGETCCEGGTYCPADSYCSNVGCCDNGLSLEECGAVRTIGTLAGDYFETSTISSPSIVQPTGYETSATSEAAEPTPTAPAYDSTSAIIEPVSPSQSSPSEDVEQPTSYSSPPVYPTHSSSSNDVTTLPTSSIPAYPSSTSPNETDTNGTLPSYTPAQQTANAGSKREVAGWTVGGMAALGMGFFL